VWTDVAKFWPLTASGTMQLFGPRELRPIVVPACNLAAAAAQTMQGSRAGSSSSSSVLWDDDIDRRLWTTLSAAAQIISRCVRSEYKFGGMRHINEGGG
jgi:hypothetical protein